MRSIRRHDAGRTALLTTIYITFVGIGLPNSILGTAWPEIRRELNLPLEYIGVFNTGLLISSMLACIFSSRIIAKFGTRVVIPIAILLFLCAMIGVSFTNRFLSILLLLIPVGYSMGTVDAGTNLYTSTHFASRNMNLLHCFWGIGALMGPVIMIMTISKGFGWRGCFVAIALIGVIPLCFVLLSSALNVWGKQPEIETEQPTTSFAESYKLPGLYRQAFSIVIFFLHTGVLSIISALLSSYLDEVYNVSIEISGLTVTIFLASLTASRVFSGILIHLTGNLMMIRIGLIVAMVGCLIGFMSQHLIVFECSIVIVGLGTGPVFPCLIHETPVRFPREVARHLVGYQIAAAQLGGSLLSLGVALLLSHTSMLLLIPTIFVLYMLIIISNEMIVKQKIQERTTAG